MVQRIVLTLLLAWLAVPAMAGTPDVRQQGADLTAAFYAGRIDEVWQRLGPQMRTALQSRDNLAAFHQQIGQQLGTETAVIDETVDSAEGLGIYRRRARFDKVPMVIVVQWAIDSEGQVQGFFVRPDQGTPQAAAPSDHLDYRTRANLRLPFEDEFHVFWGGRTVEQNYHAVHPNQRFALDLVVMRDGRTHDGQGTRNEDYYCFGRPVLAPAAGTVVEVVDTVADNVPGRMNTQQITGNRVVLDHGNREYSVLAHLRHGSTRVQAGDTVRAGQRVGDCGNSGNSSEAHLHYQLQDGPAFGASAGLPAQFVDYIADGQPVARGEPTRGQQIRPASPR